jgi:hypothetical protein
MNPAYGPSRPMVDVNVDVDPMGNLSVFARDTQAWETPSKIIEDTQVGRFRESSRAFDDDPMQILGPGMRITSTTDLEP